MVTTLLNVEQLPSTLIDDELLDTATTLNLSYTILPQQIGLRIDQIMAEVWSEFSREKLKQWLKEGYLLVDGEQVKPKYQCKGGEYITLNIQLPKQTHHVAEKIALDIIYEDDDILVINKPVGMVVHPGAGHHSGTLLNALLFHHPQAVELDRAGIVHRIDKDTSGLLVVAKTLEAQFALSQQLANKTVYRLYDLVVYGSIIAGGIINQPIRRHPTDRIKMAVCADGKEAITHYRIKQKFKHFTRLFARLETGRTHQIRVHFSYMGHPLVGDPVYLQRARYPMGISHTLKDMLQTFQRQALHAFQLGLIHPRTGQEMIFEAPLPIDYQKLLSILAQEDSMD